MKACIVLAWLLAMGGGGRLGADEAAGVTWVTVQDDDGEYESHWGCSMMPSQRICKLIELGISPGEVRAARIQYVVAVSPYHSRTRQHVDGPRDGVAWANVLVWVNGTVAARRPGIELMSKGTHIVDVPVALLREGANRIEFGWEPVGEDTPANASYGYFYVGIDTDRTTRRSLASNDGGRTWSADCLRPGAEPEPRYRGEYLVRLEIALPNGPVDNAAGVR
jgi:hypothetical protein